MIKSNDGATLKYAKGSFISYSANSSSRRERRLNKIKTGSSSWQKKAPEASFLENELLEWLPDTQKRWYHFKEFIVVHMSRTKTLREVWFLLVVNVPPWMHICEKRQSLSTVGCLFVKTFFHAKWNSNVGQFISKISTTSLCHRLLKQIV